MQTVEKGDTPPCSMTQALSRDISLGVKAI